MSGSRGLCSSCSEPVMWVKTEARGSQMPLDPKPHPKGNVVLVDIPQTKHKVARVIPPEKLPAEQPAYRSHFVTCPDPRRRPKSKKKTSSCALCRWSLVGTDTRALRAAFAQHYAEDHLDRCEHCDARLLWIRATDMTLLALDPEPVVGGEWVIAPGIDQLLASRIDPSRTPAHRLHSCPEGTSARG